MLEIPDLFAKVICLRDIKGPPLRRVLVDSRFATEVHRPSSLPPEPLPRAFQQPVF